MNHKKELLRGLWVGCIVVWRFFGFRSVQCSAAERQAKACISSE